SRDGFLPPMADVEQEESHALREWRRQNAIRLEEKEKTEKELMSKILLEAEEYRVAFHKKIQTSCETNKIANREKEKLFVSRQEKFLAEADQDYWKSISELIPKEVVPSITRKGNDKERKQTPPPTLYLQGPKPGKPTDLSRMRQLLMKLKHDSPPHLKISSPPPPLPPP
ncbi:hypothetical protein M569_04814, partial [Genlisea aurea]